MTVTLDGDTLIVEKLTEKEELVYTTSNGWSGGTYQRTLNVYGSVLFWTLTVREAGVTWDNSDAKGFKTTMAAGTAVTFTMTEPPHDISLSVFIMNVTVNYNMRDFGKRSYVLTLMEDMS